MIHKGDTMEVFFGKHVVHQTKFAHFLKTIGHVAFSEVWMIHGFTDGAHEDERARHLLPQARYIHLRRPYVDNTPMMDCN